MKEPLDLAALGRRIPWHEPSPERREQIRAELVSWSRTAPHRAPKRPAIAIAASIAAAAAIAAVATWSLRAEEAAPLASRANLVASPGANFQHTIIRVAQAESKDELVHLRDGRLELELPELQAGERFRVVAPDAEIDVEATRLTVEVNGGKLTSVSVLAGLVIVRPNDRAPRSLSSGESWSSQVTVEPPLAFEHAPPPEKVAERKPIRRQVKAAEKSVAETTPARLPDPVSSEAPVVEPPPPIAEVTPPIPQRREAMQDRPKTPIAPDAPVAATEPAEVKFREAWRLYRQNKYTDAADAFEEAEGLAGNQVLASDAAYWRIVCLLRFGDRYAAKEIQKFFEKHPRSRRRAELAVALGEILVDQRRWDEARKIFDSVLNDPDEQVRRRASEGLDRIDRER